MFTWKISNIACITKHNNKNNIIHSRGKFQVKQRIILKKINKSQQGKKTII